MSNLAFTNNGAMKNQAPQKSSSLGMGGNPIARALNQVQQPAPLMPPTGAHVKSHTISHPDGTTIAQTFHPPMQGNEKGLLKKEQPQAQMPEIQDQGGKHLVPFPLGDGKWGFIDSIGNIQQ